MIHLLNDVYAVDKIPVDANNVHAESNNNSTSIVYDIGNKQRGIDLGIGSYEYLFLSGEATEEDANGIVEVQSLQYRVGETINGWKDYEHDENEEIPDVYDVTIIPYTTALESFASLLKSKGITGKAAILRQVKK